MNDQAYSNRRPHREGVGLVERMSAVAIDARSMCIVVPLRVATPLVLNSSRDNRPHRQRPAGRQSQRVAGDLDGNNQPVFWSQRTWVPTRSNPLRNERNFAPLP